MNSGTSPRAGVTIHRRMVHKSDSALFSSRCRITFLGLSLANLLICAVGGVLHYSNLASGNLAQVVGWLLSMFFLLLAFSPRPRDVASNLRTSLNWKTVLFVFWILVFTGSRLWHFRTAPWNGDALFDESGWDLYFLKHYVIGHPYQAAWFHVPISRETLFHYYVWAFLHCFGYNILSYEAALFVIWCVTFVFTLLLVDLFFGSIIVTSVTALIFNFLPFAFIYTFAGYRYPMATALAVASLYFLHLGFRTGSRLCLSVGGLAAGLCLASSISGKQYLLALVTAAAFYAVFYWRSLMRKSMWSSLALVVYGVLAAAMPILLYIVFNRDHYTGYESGFFRSFRQALHTMPFPTGILPYLKQLKDCFFTVTVPGPRFFIPDTLPIPLPYYWLLVPGLALALWWKRFEIVLLATIPVAGAFIATSHENRLLLAIPFWIMLMSFTFAALLKLRQWPGLQILLFAIAGSILMTGLVPSIGYIYSKTTDSISIRHYAQEEVAVSRFMRHVVAGEQHPGPPHFEYNEFNGIEGIPAPSYDTLICQNDAYSIIHLFLHDYDDDKILSFCNGFYVTSEEDVWSANKRALLDYVPGTKDLKLVWERSPKTERIIKMFQSVRDLGTDDSISYSFAGRLRTFYVLNIPYKNIRQFQDQVRALPYSIP